MRITGDAAAASPQCVSRAEHHRIADTCRQTRDQPVHPFHDKGSSTQARRFSPWSALNSRRSSAFFDRLGVSYRSGARPFLPQESRSHPTPLARFSAGLSTQRTEAHCPPSSFKISCFHHLHSQRLDVYAVCDIFVCHDRRRVRVQQDNLQDPYFLSRNGTPVYPHSRTCEPPVR